MGRFSKEANACQWMLRQVLTHRVTTMGTTSISAHVHPDYQEAVHQALREVETFISESDEKA